MKNKFLAAAVILAVTLFSCRKETITLPNDSQNSTESILTGAKASTESSERPVPLVSPLWAVGSFIMNGNDETANYNGFDFEFRSDNRVIASNGRITFYGKWSIVDRHMSLYFATLGPVDDISTNVFSNLNGNWTILKQTLTSIYLESNFFKSYKELRFDKKF